MEFFKFTNTSDTDLDNGQTIRGWDSAMWVERYRLPGMFEFKALLSSGLKEFLPLGTIISHSDTLEFAFVENHEIKDDRNADPTITISGRTFDAYLENRIVGANEAYGDPTSFTEYSIVAKGTALQAVDLINDHIYSTSTIDDNDTLDDNIFATNEINGAVSEVRTIKRSTVHKSLMELLAVEDLGIKTIRKNNSGVGSALYSLFLIHEGDDTNKKKQVLFSSINGDIESADYLGTLKAYKNTALVKGKWVEEFVYTSGMNHYDRRVMLVDASDIDEQYDAFPTGGTLTTIRNKMRIRGEEALKSQKKINISNIQINPNNQFKYRVDYDIGDLVSIDGEYGEVEVRRVVEYAEIIDENGFSGFPTLAEY